MGSLANIGVGLGRGSAHLRPERSLPAEADIRGITVSVTLRFLRFLLGFFHGFSFFRGHGRLLFAFLAGSVFFRHLACFLLLAIEIFYRGPLCDESSLHCALLVQGNLT